jgi:hypothetical protein
MKKCLWWRNGARGRGRLRCASRAAMFRRTTAAGSLYWLEIYDESNAYLNGGKTYKLTVPQPVPARIF